MDKQKVFFDSSILLYLLSSDQAKANLVESLLCSPCSIISVQVLNEITNVSWRKLHISWAEIAQFLSLLRSFCKVVPLTEEMHDLARLVAEKRMLSFYDACIVASAILSGCAVLYSEDMSHGQVLDSGLRLENPFFRLKG